MREIKFRAWDNKKNKIFWPRKMEYAPAGIWWITTSNIFKDGKLEGIKQLKEHAIPGSAGDILMQYTGLKDKNGKEIYEGDICKVNDECEMNSSPFEVVFMKGFFGCSWTEDREALVDYLNDWSRKSEVIGNIYENKELLK